MTATTITTQLEEVQRTLYEEPSKEQIASSGNIDGKVTIGATAGVGKIFGFDTRKGLPKYHEILDRVFGYADKWLGERSNYAAGFAKDLLKGGRINYLKSHVDTNSAEYADFTQALKRYLDGDTFGARVHYDGTAADFKAKSVWAYWEGDDIHLLKPEEVPKIAPTAYRKLERKIAKENPCQSREWVSGHATKGLLDYMLGHEVMERYVKTRNPDTFLEPFFEATYISTLENEAKGGNMKAKPAYDGALASHYMRFEHNDPFAWDVNKFYNDLRGKVAETYESIRSSFGFGGKRLSLQPIAV